jgi:hypothetical protein
MRILIAIALLFWAHFREKCAFLQAALTKTEERADRAEQQLVEFLHTTRAGMSEDRTSPDRPAEAGGAGDPICVG